MVLNGISPAHSCPSDCPLARASCLEVGVNLATTFQTLASLGPGQLMIKSNGLTSLAELRLDKLKLSHGLITDPEKRIFFPRDIRPLLFCCPFDSSLRVVLTPDGGPGQVYLSFPKIPWDSEASAQVAMRLKTTNPRLKGKCLQNCRQWLDDWSPDSQRKENRLVQDELAQIKSSRSVTVSQNRDGIGLTMQFPPYFVDFDDSILRMCGKDQKEIAIADLHRVKIRTPVREEILLTL